MTSLIVFIRKGKGGFMYLRNEITSQKMHIKQRMLTEASKSIGVAMLYVTFFQDMWRAHGSSC